MNDKEPVYPTKKELEEMPLEAFKAQYSSQGPQDERFPDDPWIHRQENMRCRTCMFCCPKMDLEGETELGRCRRHAPTMSGYPVVFLGDWCGDHKLDENKLDQRT